MTAQIRERVDNSTSNIKVIRVNWFEFREIPGARDVLDRNDWISLEETAVKGLKRRI